MATSFSGTYSHSLDAGFTRLRLVHRAPVESLQYTFEQAFNEGDNCDMTVRTRFDELKVHRNVMCLASKVLKRALHSNYTEARDNSFNISRDGHRAACEFVRFCYQRWYDTVECGSPALIRTGSLQDYDGLVRVNGNLAWTASDADLVTAKNVANQSNKRRFHLDVEMYRMGDIYDVPSLRSQATQMLEWRLYEYSYVKGSPGPILDMVAPVYAYTQSDNNVLRRLLFRGLGSFKKSIFQDEASRSTLETLRVTVRGFDAAFRRIFSGPSANLRDEPFGWPSTSHSH